MEKKEPILTPANVQSTDVEVKETTDKKSVKDVSKTKSSKTQNKIKELKEKIKSIKVSEKQKRFIIAGLICVVVILFTCLVISIFSKDEANVAVLEPVKKVEVVKTKKTTKNVSKTKTENNNQSFLSKLFGKKDKAEEIVAPSFDIVRMEKGEAVIAGQAGKGDVVHILDNGKEIGTEKADNNGQWVFIPKKALAKGNRKLSLFVIDKNGNKIKSKQSAVLHVSDKSEDELAVVVGGNKKAKVLKAPKGQNIGALRIAKIDYNDNGSFKVEGMALKNSVVNLYMNNKLVQKVKSDKNGFWTVDTTFVLSEKEQIIRADMLGAKDKVAKRVEYKFTPVLFGNENQMTVIKKGDCLWNIALKEYGRGTDYVIIFEANKKQIKDPNKIYVGQVFSIVKKDSESFKTIKNKTSKK